MLDDVLVPSPILWKLVWGFFLLKSFLGENCSIYKFLLPFPCQLPSFWTNATLSWLLMFHRWTEIKVEFVPLWEKGREKKITVYKIFHASPTSFVLPSFWHRSLIFFCLDILGCLSGFHSSFLTQLWVSQETANFASQSKLNTAIQTQRTSMGRKKKWPQNGDFFDVTSARSYRGIWVRKAESMTP